MSERKWIKREPVHKPVTVDENYCPICDEQLDELNAINNVERCACGDWSYGIVPEGDDGNGWHFRRGFTAEEIAAQKLREVAALESRIAQLRSELQP